MKNYYACAGVLICYLKLQEELHWALDPTLAASLEPFTNYRNVTSISLFHGYWSGICSSELAILVPFPYSRGNSSRFSDIFSPFPDTIRMSMSTISFLVELNSGIFCW